ncbi:MAG: hypothetical protein CM15mP84_02420 [Cellvibrionales bacterium]|nr:MAG: hypothetical protein CM15mP84_02420 [Cellvibrionales bacterium]
MIVMETACIQTSHGARNPLKLLSPLWHISPQETGRVFTDLDLATLQSIHGVAKDAPRNFLVDEADVHSKISKQR